MTSVFGNPSEERFQTPAVSCRVYIVWWCHLLLKLSSVRQPPYWLSCRQLHRCYRPLKGVTSRSWIKAMSTTLYKKSFLRDWRMCKIKYLQCSRRKKTLLGDRRKENQTLPVTEMARSLIPRRNISVHRSNSSAPSLSLRPAAETGFFMDGKSVSRCFRLPQIIGTQSMRTVQCLRWPM